MHLIFNSNVGWGTTQFGGMKSKTLQEVMLTVITYRDCSRWDSNLLYSQLCTYGENKDACQVALCFFCADSIRLL